MNNTIIFLRHGETDKDKNIPSQDWHLTKDGILEVEKRSKEKIFNDIDVIFSSMENKAKETANPFAKKNKQKIIQDQGLNEINRNTGKYIEKKEFRLLKEKMFADLNYSKYGWETSIQALKRFEESIKDIDKKYENKKILIVSHGTVLSLYFSKLQNELNKINYRWKQIKFCDYGIIKNNIIIKDII